ncbi:MAG: ADP-forming succinate--CoA ligase subunit beta [Acidobacteriota bacterium]
MKVHEHQAKAIFARKGIPVPRGHVAFSVEEAVAASEKLAADGAGDVRVVKAQVHAGGRGKAGGVKVLKSADEVGPTAEKLLGMRLVTPQTGEEGVEVRRLLVEEGLDIARELYVAVTLDRDEGRPVVMASTEGGTEIEEVAATNPDAIVKVHAHPVFGLPDHEARRLAFALGLAADRKQLGAAVKLFKALHDIHVEEDASMVEVNPLIVTGDGDLIALDAKVNIDDNALYRHPDLAELRDTGEEDPLEVEASESDLNYIRLDGNIGCMVNGAGLAMATMDMIKLAGGEPANFLDVGGSASADGVADALRILLKDENVKAVLINVFGGIVRCDLVAEGVVEGAKRVGVNLPVVVRIEGNRAAEGRKVLESAPFELIVTEDMESAAKAAVKAAGGAA